MSAAVRPFAGDAGWRAALDEQLGEELGRLRLLLRRQIDWLRCRSGHEPLGGLGSLVVTDEQARLALEGDDSAARADFYRASELNRRIASLDEQLRERAAIMMAAGTPFPIDALVAAFALDDFARDTVMLALAPELDPGIPRLFAYAQDDAAARHATPALAAALFGHAAYPGRRDAEAFRPDDPLTRFALVRRCVHHAGGAVTRPIWLEPRVAWYLRGVEALGPSDGVALRSVPPAAVPAEFATAANAVADALLRAGSAGRAPAVNLVGPSARQAAALAGAIARRLGMAMHAPTFESDALAAEVVMLLDRECVLRDTVYLIEVGDDDLPEPVAEIVDAARSVVVIAGRFPVRLLRPVVTVNVPQPPPASQRELWSRALGPGSGVLEGALPAIVHHFDLDPEAIARVAVAAQGAARLRGEPIAEQDLWVACRAYGRRRLGGLADRIEPAFGWDDIVLPAVARTQLEEIVAQVQHRATVYEDWQFARRLPRGRGVTALFAGPSGTGKTMAAEVLARELKLDLYRIDLAGVVNKYIGETEKNLRQIFLAAEESGAILFFDEADALFGKRTEVRDSHDRYANIEVNYLLQRMEEYTGLAILATNRRSVLDRAFLRRLRFLVDFPLPAADSRLRIWQKVLPPAAPVSRIDFGVLSRLDVSGGNIQSIAVNAAFLAAADGRVITMSHLMHAAAREYSKLDKAPTESEFGAITRVVAS